MKAGDKFIHFTKYGGVNRGTIASMSSVSVIDLKHGVLYSKPILKTDKGVSYDITTDGDFFVIEMEYTPEQIKGYTGFIENMAKRKKQAIAKMDERNKDIFEELKKKHQ